MKTKEEIIKIGTQLNNILSKTLNNDQLFDLSCALSYIKMAIRREQLGMPTKGKLIQFANAKKQLPEDITKNKHVQELFITYKDLFEIVRFEKKCIR